MKDELDEFGFPLFEQNPFPLAYLLTFRTYGTWLHGDKRTSVRRNANTRYGGHGITPSAPLTEFMRNTTSEPTLVLTPQQRTCIDTAIKEVCDVRKYVLLAQNVRTNHAHAVISAQQKPEKIVNDLKAYATRLLRTEGLCTPTEKVWSRGASTRYLWKPKHVDAAVDYVKYCQEDIPFEFRES